MPDRHEHAGDVACSLTVPSTVLVTSMPVDRGVAVDLGHRVVPEELDLRVGEGAVLHDLAGPQLVAAVDDRDLVGELGEEGGLLDRRVAAADDGDLLAAEEEAVAGRAGRQPVARAGVDSASRPSISDWAPVDTMIDVGQVESSSRTQTLNGRSEKSTW